MLILCMLPVERLEGNARQVLGNSGVESRFGFIDERLKLKK